MQNYHDLEEMGYINQAEMDRIVEVLVLFFFKRLLKQIPQLKEKVKLEQLSVPDAWAKKKLLMAEYTRLQNE